MTSPITRYRFRHRAGFTPEMFACFQAQCVLWSERLKAVAQGWKHLYLGQGMTDAPAPRYEFHGPELSQDGQEVSFAVGGERSYGAAKIFEDTIPKDLWQFFPPNFQEELEYECGGKWFALSALKQAERDELLCIAKMLADQSKQARGTG
jgi:hypothetical protein